MAFFKKVACFTDIHFGMKGNSRIHNDDFDDFVKWIISQAKAEGCETCIFLVTGTTIEQVQTCLQ